MATTTLLTPTSSQLSVDVAPDSGLTVSISSVTLQPQPGAARLATVRLAITPTAVQAYNATIQFLFTDAGFEENDIWGAPKGSGTTSASSGTVI